MATINEEQTTVYVEEMKLLRKIVETSENLIWARVDSLRAEQLGGIKEAEFRHANAVAAHKQWLSDFDTPFD